jgi:hypothetical protein
MTSSPSDIDLAARLIRAYLSQHPHSADTLDGIHQWWMNGAVARAAVEAALEQLALDGEIEHIDIGRKRLWRRARPAA